MEIKEALFTKSSNKLQQCPKEGKVEFAFIGRSNVGKSSLINMLTQKKGLAKTSQTPGKTQLINHFLVNNTFYIVDLPGYGYAKVPKNIRADFEKMIDGYILQREELANLFLLIDGRHKPMQIDLQFIEKLGLNGVPFSIVFTKADKLSRTALNQNIQAFSNHLLQTWESLPPLFITSAEKGIGREEILTYMDEILESI